MRRFATEQIALVEPTPLFGPTGLPTALEERVLSDGSRFRVYRRCFDPGGLAEELGGRVLFGKVDSDGRCSCLRSSAPGRSFCKHQELVLSELF